MRTFEHFPEKETCVVCGTNKDAECVLITKDGTQDGHIAEAIPVHVECIDPSNMLYFESLKAIGIFPRSK